MNWESKSSGLAGAFHGLSSHQPELPAISVIKLVLRTYRPKNSDIENSKGIACIAEVCQLIWRKKDLLSMWHIYSLAISTRTLLMLSRSGMV